MICIDEKRCTGCGLCVADCVAEAIHVVDGKAIVDQGCFACGHCVAICPFAAPSAPNYSDDPVEYDEGTFALSSRNLLNTIKYRRSIRDFQQRPLSYDDLHLLIDAAAHTPTAKNTQANRFTFIQDSLPEFKDLIWGELRDAHRRGEETVIPSDVLEGFLGRKDVDDADDYLFRNAPALLCIESMDPLDAGLAAQAFELMATTRNIGVLYNGYLRRVIEHSARARAYFDASDERILAAVMLVGYSNTRYRRTAPRRNPSVVLR